jgi:hypothetical protein
MMQAELVIPHVHQENAAALDVIASNMALMPLTYQEIFEQDRRIDPLAAQHSTVVALESALEAAGVEFIDNGGDQPGVRLMARRENVGGGQPSGV